MKDEENLNNHREYHNLAVQDAVQDRFKMAIHLEPLAF